MTYPNKAMEAVCEMMLDDWNLTREQAKHLAHDLFREYSGLCDDREEADYMQRQRDLQENGGDGGYDAYRRDMIAAGRGHLLGR